MGFDDAFQAADAAVRAIRDDGLRDIDRVVLEGSWHRQTYQKIAAEAGYTEGYLSRDIGPALWNLLSEALGMQVKKTNFRTAIERWSKLNPVAEAERVTLAEGKAGGPPDLLGAAKVPAIDVTDFRGRHQELADLSAWITEGRGRLLGLSGMPGVGKTWLATKLGQTVQSHFDQVIYRELGDRLPAVDFITVLLRHLTASPPVPQPSLQGALELLIQALDRRPSLLVLDGAEVFCTKNAFAGTCTAAFTGYDQFLEAIATRDHQSCIIWIGRELPRTPAYVAGSGCRLHRVTGLSHAELPELAIWPPGLLAAEADWRCLQERYGGLLTVVQAILPRLTPFGNNLAACLSALAKDPQFVHPYLEVLLSPLSEPEWTFLTWLMTNCRPLPLSEIDDRLGTPTLPVIESLCDRGLCQVVAAHNEPAWEMTLADLLGPHLQRRFLATLRAAEAADIVELLHRYPLLQAEAPETVRTWQMTHLLEAVANSLAAQFPQPEDRQRFLQQSLAQSRRLTRERDGYSAGNLINIAQHWKASLMNIDCQGLVLQEADLQSDVFQGVSLQGANLARTLLAKPIGQAPVIAISPTQPLVAVGDQEGRLLLWNLHTGRLQKGLLSFPEAIRAIAFSLDGTTLVAGRQDGAIRLWDLGSDYGPELFAQLPESVPEVLALSPDKTLLAGGDDSGYLYVWRVASGEQLHRIAAHGAPIAAIAFSPCSQWLTTCGRDAKAAEWDLKTGAKLHQFQGRLTAWLGHVAYLPTSRGRIQAVAVGRDENQIVIWDVRSARPLRVLSDPCDPVMAFALSPNGRYLAASDVSSTLSVWNVSSRTRLHHIPVAHAPAESLVFSPDSALLVTGSDYRIQMWDTRLGKCVRRWQRDRHSATDFALTVAPLQLASSHEDHTLRCWQLESPHRWLPRERLQLPGTASLSTLATHGEPSSWIAGTEEGTVYLWQAAAQAWRALPVYLAGSITALALSPDGESLAMGDAAGTVALWELSQNDYGWQVFQAHGDKVGALAFSPDGQQIFSGSRDHTVKGWSIKGEAVAALAGHRRRVHALCVSQGGDTLYSGSYDGTVRFWDIQTQECTRVWQQRDRLIHGLVRDITGQPLAIVSDTRSLEIWDLTSETCRHRLMPHAENLWHVRLSTDGQGLVSASQDGEVRIWSLATGELQGQLWVDRPYEAMRIGGCTGLTDSERQMLYSLGAKDY